MIESYIDGRWRTEKYLSEAIGSLDERGLVISVVGAGGKTTIIRRLMKEAENKKIPVIVTTTTHIQAIETDYFLGTPSKERLKQILAKEGKVWMGSPCAKGKLESFSEEFLRKVIEMGEEMGILLLIEADGARGLPCKAPADYEPVILPETGKVLLVYGLDAVGRRIDQVCLREEYVSEILGKDCQQILTAHDIAVLASDGRGGRKGVADWMDYHVTLNKADDPGRREIGMKVAKELSRYGIRQVHMIRR